MASTEVAAGSGGAAGGEVWAFEVFTARSVKAASAVRWKNDMGSGAPVEFIVIVISGR
jgi:hypothetical protein